VQVTDRVGDLTNDVSGQVLGEISEFDDLVEKFSSLHHCKSVTDKGLVFLQLTFEDQKVELIALGKADELDDIGVIDTSHDLNFLEDVCSLYCQHKYVTGGSDLYTAASHVQMPKH